MRDSGIVDPALGQAFVDAAAQLDLAVGVITAEGRYVYVNAAAAAAHGRPADVDLGADLEAVLGPTAPVVRELVDEVLATGTARVDLRLEGRLTADGPSRSWRANYLPVRYGEGQAVVIIAQEVTGQLQAEAEVVRRARQQASLARMARGALRLPTVTALIALVEETLLGDLAAEVVEVRHGDAPGIPVVVGDRRWGTVLVRMPPGRPLDDADRVHVVATADLVAGAVEREAREQRLIDLAAERERLVTELLSADERQRLELASMLHDELLQDLLYARHECQAVWEDTGTPAAGRAADALAGAAERLRTLISGVHPVAISSAGLPSTLAAVAAEAKTRFGFEVELDVATLEDGEFDGVLVSAVRELLTNAGKHAGASRVVVRLGRVDDELVLDVADDGRGAAPDLLDRAVGDGGLGLAGLQARARALGGDVGLAPAAGGGLRVVLHLPLAAA